MKNVEVISVGPSHKFPLNPPIMTKLRPSRRTSSYCPLLMCQARTPRQSPYVGARPKWHGQGISHLHTSNQSPSRCHSSTTSIYPQITLPTTIYINYFRSCGSVIFFVP